jgi:hypothetical protein
MCSHFKLQHSLRILLVSMNLWISFSYFSLFDMFEAEDNIEKSPSWIPLLACVKTCEFGCVANSVTPKSIDSF